MRNLSNIYKIVILYIICIIPFCVNAQFLCDLSYRTESYYGFILNHHPHMKHLTQAHFPAFEFSVEKQTDGSAEWHQYYRYPKIGLSFWYSSLGKNEYLGYSLALIPYIDFPLIKKKSRYKTYFQLGCGIGYLSNPFDRIDNIKNNAIGSHYNATIRVMLDQYYKINDNFNISTGIGLTHFSNGAVTMPNYGINNATIKFGLTYIPSITERKNIKFEKKSIPKWQFDIYSLTGIKENYPPCGPKYWSTTLCADIVHLVNRGIDIYSGIDFIYDEAKKNILMTDSVIINNNIEYVQCGLKTAIAWKMNNFSIHLQLGAYIYTKCKKNAYIYDRLMLRYKFREHWLFNIALKTHYGRADVFEWGIGYRF